MTERNLKSGGLAIDPEKYDSEQLSNGSWRVTERESNCNSIPIPENAGFGWTYDALSKPTYEQLEQQLAQANETIKQLQADKADNIK
jgi:hypothetical protein